MLQPGRLQEGSHQDEASTCQGGACQRTHKREGPRATLRLPVYSAYAFADGFSLGRIGCASICVGLVQGAKQGGATWEVQVRDPLGASMLVIEVVGAARDILRTLQIDGTLESNCLTPGLLHPWGCLAGASSSEPVWSFLINFFFLHLVHGCARAPV